MLFAGNSKLPFGESESKDVSRMPERIAKLESDIDETQLKFESVEAEILTLSSSSTNPEDVIKKSNEIVNLSKELINLNREKSDLVARYAQDKLRTGILVSYSQFRVPQQTAASHHISPSQGI